MIEVGLGVIFFTLIVLVMTFIILVARSYLVQSGEVSIEMNEGKILRLPVGVKLLSGLASQGVFVSSACGGGGTCGQCRVKVLEGGGSLLATEKTYISKRDALEGDRLSCQVTVKRDLKVELPPEVAGCRQWECTVKSNEQVASFIKNLVIELPAGEDIDFRAGGYVQIKCPPHQMKYSNIETGDFDDVWKALNLYRYESMSDEEVSRAYSMANYPDEKGVVMLNVRVAVPPPNDPNVPPGIASSYLAGLKPGDKVMVSGPFGDFFARETDNEMIFIGGGAGMAPMRSHIFDQLRRIKTNRKITFWYGARSKRELFFVHDFDNLAEQNENFDWYIALSEPQDEDNWDGKVGFIHNVLYEEYLKDHPAPEDCEYYICGPPVMLAAVRQMLDDLGVDPENILFDDFGG